MLNGVDGGGRVADDDGHRDGGPGVEAIGRGDGAGDRIASDITAREGVFLARRCIVDGPRKRDCGGVVIGICDEMQLPVRYIGIGEKTEDLRAFDPSAFADALFDESA